MAAIDSLTTFIVMIFYEVYKNPEIANKVHQEVQKYFLNQQLCTYLGAENLKYTHNFNREVLRLHPTANNDIKSNDTGLFVGTAYFKPNTVFLSPRYAILRDKNIFKDPDTNNPDRYVDQAQEVLNKMSELLVFLEV